MVINIVTRWYVIVICLQLGIAYREAQLSVHSVLF